MVQVMKMYPLDLNSIYDILYQRNGLNEFSFPNHCRFLHSALGILFIETFMFFKIFMCYSCDDETIAEQTDLKMTLYSLQSYFILAHL